MLINKRAKYLFWLITFVCLYTSANSQAEERWQNKQYISDSFLKIALQLEYGNSVPKLIRWESPIKLFFQSDLGDESLQKELISVQAQHLSSITGVPIRFTVDTKNANMLVIFTSYAQMEEKVAEYMGNPDNYRTALNEAICIGHFNTNKRSQIIRSVIIIPVDFARQRARFLDCIVEEITQLMGLPNDSDEVYPSIFNDVSIDAYLSPLDYILLKLLYSPRLNTGMSVAETLTVLPNAIQDLAVFGDIEHAAQRVRENSLQSYIGD